jgi:hypothetical protein
VNNQLSDIIATISLLSTEAGGRRGPTPDGKFNCLMTIDEKNLDVRLRLERTGSLSPGQTATIPISFLDLEYAKGTALQEGNSFSERSTS